MLPAVDWSAPWFEPWRETGSRIIASLDARPFHEALNGQGAPVRFVPQSDLGEGDAYESHVFRTGCCPTRATLHDFFNGLCWIQFPQSKQKLNELHAAEMERPCVGVGSRRGLVRDAITILDENGALLHA